jgi:hypothetical protein
MPWLYLGGFFAVFLGYLISLIGGFLFLGGHEGLPAQDRLRYRVLIGLGIIVFACGAFLLAR